MNNRIIKYNIAMSFSVCLIIFGCGQVAKKNTTPNGHSKVIQDAQTLTKDENDVKVFIDKLLIAVGNYDMGAIKDMSMDKANVGEVRIQNNSWVASSLTVDEFIEYIKASKKLIPYYEPTVKYKIQISDGEIAYMWDDGFLHRFGVPISNNTNNFTLIKKDGLWKLLNASYTIKPLSSNQAKFDLEIFAKGYAQVWSSKRPEFVALFFEEGGALQVNEGQPATGRKAITEFVKGFMINLPDMSVRFDSIVNKPNDIEFHRTLTGTNSGPGGTGKKVKISGFELWQIGEGGLIKKSQSHFPIEEYNRQLKFGSEN